MELGHNDGAKEKRTATLMASNNFKIICLSSKRKEALPIILTPVARDYPWKMVNR